MRITFLTALLALTLTQVRSQTLKDAIRLNENEQQDEAEAVFQQLIAREPANGNLYYHFGENFIDAEKPEQAAQAFSMGLQKDAANAINLIGQGELKLMNGDLEGGRRLIEQAVKAGGGKNAMILLEAGEAYMRYKKAQDLMSAQTQLEAALKLESAPLDIELIDEFPQPMKIKDTIAGKHLRQQRQAILQRLQHCAIPNGHHSTPASSFSFAISSATEPTFTPALRPAGSTVLRTERRGLTSTP